MTNTWKVQDAKARFSELLEASMTRGPQIVTRRGLEAAVLLPIEQWRSLTARAKPGLKEVLLAPLPRSEALAAPRKKHRHRKTPRF